MNSESWITNEGAWLRVLCTTVSDIVPSGWNFGFFYVLAITSLL